MTFNINKDHVKGFIIGAIVMLFSLAVIGDEINKPEKKENIIEQKKETFSLGNSKTFFGITLFFNPPITSEEVDRLGKYLIKSTFANGSERSIQLVKNENTYEFKMPIKKGIEQDDDYAITLKSFAKEISDSVFYGQQVDVHALDENLNTLRVYPMSSY